MKADNLRPTSPDENGYTPVHAAASWGHVELLRWLLEQDSAGANVQDNDGDTPLHHLAVSDLAASELRPVVELLLAHGADPEARNSEEQTCLEAARTDAMDDDMGACCEESQEHEMSRERRVCERRPSLSAAATSSHG